MVWRIAKAAITAFIQAHNDDPKPFIWTKSADAVEPGGAGRCGKFEGAFLGSGTLALAEEEARRRGCRAGVLYTISFQAPGFYKRLGWRVFGEIPCGPPAPAVSFLPNLFAEAVNRQQRR